MIKMLKNFKDNFKKYFDYLMTVNFGDLFINVLILLCIVLLSTFVFIPVGLIESVIRDFVLLFVDMSTMVLSIYDWIFTLLSTIFSLLAFIYLFNKRFEDIEAFKQQFNNKKRSDNSVKNDEPTKDSIELPKVKDHK